MAMACLSMNKTLTFASLTNPNNNNINPKKSQHLDLGQQQQRQMKKPHKPTVAEIERAIGAGIMNRDVDPKDLDKIANVVDGLLMNSTINEFEGAIEKKLRETGESLVEVTEKGIRSSGKSILLFVLQWILPIWVFSFLVASGIIKLPFSTPFLDNLIL